jgi:nucleotide-binding universal stress UspA family protein
LDRLAPIASGTGATVTLLHVMSQLPIPPVGAPADWLASTETLLAEGTAEGTLLEQDLALLAAAGVTARPMVRHGLVLDEVLAELEAGDYDLLVIGGHEPGDWLHKLLLENVALQLLHRSRRSVLTMHG